MKCLPSDYHLALIFLTKVMKNAMLCKIIQKYEKLRRRNFSLVARYSLNFNRCSFLVPRSTNHSLFVAKFARYSLQKLLVGKNYSLLVAEVARCKKSLVTRCKIRSLLVAEVSRCKKLLVTCCRSCSLQKNTRYSLQISLVTRIK